MENSRTASLLSSRAVEVLRQACANVRTRRIAIRDPKALLAKRGVPLADGVELHLYEGSAGLGRKRGGGVARPNDGTVEAHFGRLGTIEGIPPGLESWWESTHEGCPLFTYPYKTKKKKSVCDLWGLAVSGHEWVPVAEGSPYGHWEYGNVQSVCLLSHDIDVEVTECLPRFIVTS
jgi:hypothetical protein